MSFSGYRSLCNIHDKRIVSKDPGNKPQHIANNRNASEIYKYRVDGEMIQSGEKCDYLLWNASNNTIYLLELKGSKLEKALDQLDETEAWLKKNILQDIEKQTMNYRVVLNRVPTHSLNSVRTTKFIRQHKGKYRFGCVMMEEDI